MEKINKEKETTEKFPLLVEDDFPFRKILSAFETQCRWNEQRTDMAKWEKYWKVLGDRSPEGILSSRTLAGKEKRTFNF